MAMIESLAMAGMFALNLASPGASFVLTVGNSLQHGRKVGFAVALGLSVIDALFICAAVAGVATLTREYPNTMWVIGYLGGGWIAAIGVRMLLTSLKSTGHTNQAAEQKLSTWQGWRLGMGGGISNVQTMLFLISLCASESIQSAWICAAILITTSITVRCGLVRLVTNLAIKNLYLARRTKIEKICGVALTAYGSKVAIGACTPLALSALF